MTKKIPESKAPLSPEALEARRKYAREYRKRNPDRVRQWNVNHWEKMARAAATQPEPAEERQEG